MDFSSRFAFVSFLQYHNHPTHRCPSSQHCDYVDKDNCQTGQCLDGEPCYSAQFQTEAKCPNYCKWKEQPINDDGLSIGVCTDNSPYAGKQN